MTEYQNPTIPGIEFCAYRGTAKGQHNVHALVMDKDGHIGALKIGPYTLAVKVAPGIRAIVCHVDGQKNIAPKPEIVGNSGLYEATVEVAESLQENCLTTKYPTNAVRVFVYTGNGVVEDWEIALPSQNGEGYVTGQKLKQNGIRCFRGKDGEFRCPEYEPNGKFPGWPQLLKILPTMIQGDALPSIEEYRPDDPVSTEGLTPGTGRVKFFSLSQGWGAIMTIVDGKQVDARVHRKNIHAKRERLAHLVSGELVHFRELVQPNQTNQNRKTNFPFEATGVEPL